MPAGWADGAARTRHCSPSHGADAPSDASTDSAGAGVHHSSPFAYVDNRPTAAVDPDGCDAVYIAFPEYQAEVLTVKNKTLGINHTFRAESGHAGVLLINNKTGTTKYYEYGRYDPPANRGLVQKSKHPRPTSPSGPTATRPTRRCCRCSGQLSAEHGHGRPIDAAYIPSDKFKWMNDYALKKFAENKDPAREEYAVTGHNCATFVQRRRAVGPQRQPPRYYLPVPQQRHQRVPGGGLPPHPAPGVPRRGRRPRPPRLPVSRSRRSRKRGRASRPATAQGRGRNLQRRRQGRGKRRRRSL